MWKTVTIKYVGLYIPDDFSLIAVQWKRGILLRLCAIYFSSLVHFSLETVITYDASIFVDHACLRTFFSLPNSFYPKARNCFWRLGEPKLGYRCAWVHRHWRCFFLNRRKRLAEYGKLYKRTGKQNEWAHVYDTLNLCSERRFGIGNNMTDVEVDKTSRDGTWLIKNEQWMKLKTDETYKRRTVHQWNKRYGQVYRHRFLLDWVEVWGLSAGMREWSPNSRCLLWSHLSPRV